jgi:hypothetical protein
VRHEVIPYVSIVVVSLLLALAFTAAADLLARAVTEDIALRSVIVGAAYLGTSAVMFVAKFVLFDRLVFRDPDRAR